MLGSKSVRMNSPQALGPSVRPQAIPRSSDGYLRNLDIIPLILQMAEIWTIRERVRLRITTQRPPFIEAPVIRTSG